jgi:hypothetical protein
MASQMWDPFIKTMLAPGDAGNGHGGEVINMLDDTTDIVSLALVQEGSGATGYEFDEADDFRDSVEGGGASIATATVSSGTAAIITPAFEVKSDDSGYGAGGIGWYGAPHTVANAMTGVGDGTETVDAIVIYIDVGTAATDPLVCWIDGFTGNGFTPNSSTIEITWDTGANRIFQIG